MGLQCVSVCMFLFSLPRPLGSWCLRSGCLSYLSKKLLLLLRLTINKHSQIKKKYPVMVRMVRVLVKHGLMPPPRRQLDLAALGLGCWRLVQGSGVVGIGLCTREFFWDPLARAIALRPLERAGCGQALGCQLGVSWHAARIVHSNAGLTLCTCLVLFVLRVCVLESSVLPLAPLRCRKRMQQRQKRLYTATRASHCARALSSLSCVFVFSSRVCCLCRHCVVGNACSSAGNACSGAAACVGACSQLHA